MAKKKLGRFQKLFRKSAPKSYETRQLLDFLGLSEDVDQDVLSEATYFTCLKILSESVGKMPIRVMRKTEKNGMQTLTDHQLYNLLHDRPNKYQTASAFWSQVEWNRNHYGNAYVWIKGAGKNLTLWILPSDQVKVWYDDKKILSDQPDIYYFYYAGGKIYKFGSEEILHFRTSQTRDGIVGISIAEQLSNTLEASVKSQKLVGKMYDSGFTAKAVLNYTGNLNDENVETLVSNIEQYAKGALKDSPNSNIIPVPLGFSLQPLSINFADAQFLEIKKFTATQVSAAMGVRPFQYNDLDKSSYASAEAQQLSFYVDTLLFILSTYEQEISYKLLTTKEIESGVRIKFNTNVILRTDVEKQMNMLVSAVGNGIYTPDEARALLDMGSQTAGDRLYCNGSNIPLEFAGIQYGDVDDETDGEEPPISENE